MDIAVIGTGYVGLVTGTCFASLGNNVTCIDVVKEKVDKLNAGEIPIYEPGLKELLESSRSNITFTCDISEVAFKDIIFICVGTPMGEDGSADLQYVLSAASDIGKYITNNTIVVDKSTVPVGTAEKVRDVIRKEIASKNFDITFDVVSNPEFLKEGSAVNDFLHPDRVVIGTSKSADTMKQLYNFVDESRILIMDTRSAELTKYASNAMLATKISFINEISNICERVNANVNLVRNGMGMDKRIGFSFINPGCGYGGSCFPKDVQALIRTSLDNHYQPKILEAVEEVNAYQKTVLFNKVLRRFGDLSNKQFAVWGLAFKPNTDDMRESPAITLIKLLQKHNADIVAHDPKAEDTAKFYLNDIRCVKDKYTALNNSDALIINTDWPEYSQVNFAKVKQYLKNPIIFDGRNMYDSKFLENLGFEYYQIGV